PLRFPFGAPLPAAPPCIRQRVLPATAGDWHGVPRLVRARQRGARRKRDGSRVFRCMGLSSVFVTFPPPSLAHRANDCLSAGFDVHEHHDPWHGWIFAHNQASLGQMAVFNSTPTGERGGIWQAGRGLAADEAGNLYLMTGNGTVDFDRQDVGESFLRLSHDLALEDWFTPSDHACWNQHDLDMGSSGPLLLPSVTGDTQPSRIIGGGKPGILYLLSSARLGGENHFQPLHWILATKPLSWVGIPCA